VIQHVVAIQEQEGGLLLLGNIWINDRARACIRILRNTRVHHGIGLNSMRQQLPCQRVSQV
jgi:hypothetical protein